MKIFVQRFFEKWYNPIILITIVGIVCVFLLSSGRNEYIFNFSIGLPILLILISGINALYKIFKKNYKIGILQLISTITLFIAGVIISGMILMFYPFDFYADNLEIPKNIKIEKPVDLDTFNNDKRPTKIINKKINTIDFQLYNSFQPGIYTYDVWTNRNEKGFYYLKFIEITKNDTLSEMSKKDTKILDTNKTKNLKRLELKDDFTIYEGDWEKPYAARFELWFHNDSLKTDNKLISKNYIIEGWQR